MNKNGIKLVLESILFFIIGFHAINICLASYSSIIIKEETANKYPKIIKNNNEKISYSSIFYIRKNPTDNITRSQSFSDKEIKILEKICKNMDNQEEFVKFMDSCLYMDKQKFMNLVLKKEQEYRINTEIIQANTK